MKLWLIDKERHKFFHNKIQTNTRRIMIMLYRLFFISCTWNEFVAFNEILRMIR